MKTRKVLGPVGLSILLLGPAMAQTSPVPAIPPPAGAPASQTAPPSDAEKKLINKLMQEQQLLTVNGVATPDGFMPDKDPNTMQVVFLSDPNAKAKVSEDGEVVFMPENISLTQQSYLTYEAFRRKAKRILAIQIPPAPAP